MVRNDASVALPDVLAARQQRWPVLQQSLRIGLIQFDADTETFQLSTDATPDDRRLLMPLCDAENTDRRQTTILLRTIGQIAPGSPAEAALLQTTADIRRQFIEDTTRL